MIKRYIKKPVEVEALEWDGTNCAEVAEFCGPDALFVECDGQKQLRIITLEGMMISSVGDFIIKGVDGEFYPCKPLIFKATYDLVKENENLE